MSAVPSSQLAESPVFNPQPEHVRSLPRHSYHEVTSRTPVPTAGQATIGKALVIRGEITGSEPMFIDGKLEGKVNLPGNRVTIGCDGNVEAAVSAREIIVLGKVRGNLTATHRIEIRAEGSVIGDVIADSISIEDGAYFKGAIHIRKPQATLAEMHEPLLLAQA